jgi:hypothetical protein
MAGIGIAYGASLHDGVLVMLRVGNEIVSCGSFDPSDTTTATSDIRAAMSDEQNARA